MPNAKDSLIEKLEEMIEEEDNGVDDYKELQEDLISNGFKKAAEIIAEIIQDEKEHQQMLTEAIQFVEDGD